MVFHIEVVSGKCYSDVSCSFTHAAECFYHLCHHAVHGRMLRLRQGPKPPSYDFSLWLPPASCSLPFLLDILPTALVSAAPSLWLCLCPSALPAALVCSFTRASRCHVSLVPSHPLSMSKASAFMQSQRLSLATFPCTMCISVQCSVRSQERDRFCTAANT